MGPYGDLRGPMVSTIWYLVGPPEATAKPKGGRRKIAAPHRPHGGLLGPARVGRGGQRVTAQPAPPGAVIGRKNFVFWGMGGSALVWWLGGLRGGGERGAAQGVQRGTAQGRGAGLPHTGAVRDCAGVPRGSGQELRKGRSRSCTGALPGAIMGAAPAQEAQHAAALGRGLRLRRGAVWGCAGA